MSRRPRSGVTLVELLMAVTITVLLSVVLGGIVMAVQTACEHTAGLEDATLQAQVALERMEYTVAQAGVYRINEGPTTLGLAVVSRRWSVVDLPEVLVVWCGGRQGGMAAAGLQTRLPRVDEVLIYAPDPTEPGRLVEFAFPESNAELDFSSAGFSQTVLALLSSSGIEAVPLCDRVRRSQLNAFAGFSASTAGNVRFELVQTPSDAELAATVPGTSAWQALPWAQGVAAGDSGLRQATLRIELQVEPRPRAAAGTATKSIAIPFFGSASCRYAYHP